MAGSFKELNCNSKGKNPKMIKITEVAIESFSATFSMIESTNNITPPKTSNNSISRIFAKIFGKKSIKPKP